MKKILILGLLATLFVACGDNSQISTNDFNGNCKVIRKTKFDMSRLSEKDREEYKQYGISQIDVLVVKTLDVDKPEIHHITSIGTSYATSKEAIKTAKAGEVYYLDVMYYRDDPIGRVADFSPTKNYGIPLGRKEYAGKAEVIDMLLSPQSESVIDVILKTLDTEKPTLYVLSMIPKMTYNDVNRKNLQAAEVGKTYYIEVSFSTSSRRTAEVKKFSPL